MAGRNDGQPDHAAPAKRATHRRRRWCRVAIGGGEKHQASAAPKGGKRDEKEGEDHDERRTRGHPTRWWCCRGRAATSCPPGLESVEGGDAR
ncbi:hypothetical protein B0H10DRAFT_2054844 [Mycena sp. CBHHK59/15]|nr:hypothetical protein B0H10DRAFT_2054844 [Mycena sp. CBHHK59/15]